MSLEIHFSNLCDCDECVDRRIALAEARHAEQLTYHDRDEDICCEECPRCWCHY